MSLILLHLVFLAGGIGAQPAPSPPAAPDAERREAPRDALPEAPPIVPAKESNPGILRNLGETISGEGMRLLNRLPPAPPNVVRAILGFVGLLVLAYLGGHPRVQRIERRLNIAHLTAVGMPFVFLGFLASRPFLSVLTPSVLVEIAPLLPLGLGWIGFVIGARFTGSALNAPAPGVGSAVFASTMIPFAVIFGLATVLLLGGDVFHGVTDTAGAFRDAILLAAAGTMTARSAPHFFAPFSPDGGVSPRSLRIIELEQLAGIFAMMAVSSFFRPPGGQVSWQLPGVAWLFIVFGVGTIMGLVISAILNSLKQDSQFTAALLGAIAFAAGMAGYLRLSPLAVCCYSGVIMMNLGTGRQRRAFEVLERMERPIYLLFLVLAGAYWKPWEWQGWVLMCLFVAGRFLSKWLATAMIGRFFLSSLSVSERWTLTGAPMGALSVAIVISAQDLYAGQTSAWIVTAVIGGTLVMETLLQIMARRVLRAAPAVVSVD
ncbi:MAG: hypothetical protein LC126_28855 [Bryobacterales bacterium]|nr:hypothetical protein [Bryobacterales bacterium]